QVFGQAFDDPENCRLADGHGLLMLWGGLCRLSVCGMGRRSPEYGEAGQQQEDTVSGRHGF
ncbi:MAG: hypothetical protein Q8R88_04775, partial [Desulfoprunum sp.]|nr:hypothetical protein [Desulfoprunum sp.]